MSRHAFRDCGFGKNPALATLTTGAFIMSHEKAWQVQKWAWALFIVLFLAGCGLGGPAHKEPDRNAAAVVDMGFMDFKPASITIHKGQMVEWRNTALIGHTVTDEPAKAHHPQLAGLPPKAPAFDSGEIKAGKVYEHVFTVPGTYKYYCKFHAEHGMAGTVTVLP